MIEESARAVPKTSGLIDRSSLIMNLAAYALFDLPEGETFLSCAAFEPHVGGNGMRRNDRISQRVSWPEWPSPNREIHSGGFCSLKLTVNDKRGDSADGVSVTHSIVAQLPV